MWGGFQSNYRIVDLILPLETRLCSFSFIKYLQVVRLFTLLSRSVFYAVEFKNSLSIGIHAILSPFHIRCNLSHQWHNQQMMALNSLLNEMEASKYLRIIYQTLAEQAMRPAMLIQRIFVRVLCFSFSSFRLLYISRPFFLRFALCYWFVSWTSQA